MTVPPNIRVETQTPFPAPITDTDPATVGRVNGVWQIGMQFQRLGIRTPPVGNFPSDFLIAWNSIVGNYYRLPLSVLGAGGIPVVGTPLNQTGLTGPNHGPYSLLDTGAAAVADALYQVNLYLSVTTGDPLRFADAVGFRVRWTDITGVVTKHFALETGNDIPLNTTGNTMWVSGLVYNLAGNDVTVETFLSAGATTGTAVFSIRGRVLLLG